MGDICAGKFRAHIDYHSKNNPRWAHHQAVLEIAQTEEFKTWFKNNNTFTGQLEFAQFIEDNLQDIVDPDGASMLEMCKTLEAKSGVGFTGKVSLQSGIMALNYQDDSTVTSGVIEVPEKFTLKVPIFLGMPDQAITCRFRWKIARPSLALGYSILGLDRKLSDAIRAAGDIINEELKTEVLYGKL